MVAFLAAAFAVGFLGSLHCVGMCGGLLGAMTSVRSAPWWPGVIVYQFGRITTYTGLGLVAGLVGATVGHEGWLNGLQSGISIFAGIVIILLALYIGGWLPDPFRRLTEAVSKRVGLGRWMSAAASRDVLGPWYSVGVLNGLLPCGLVYAGVGLSLTATSAWQGAAAMFVFGLGTVPAMVAVPFVMRSVKPAMRGHVVRVGAVLLIGIGAFTVVRGTPLGQHDHAGHIHQATLTDGALCVDGADSDAIAKAEERLKVQAENN